LHEQRGEFGAALAAIRRKDWTLLAGDTAGAIRAYQRYLGIRSDADARLQPEVQRVRAELAALERASTHR
jgi:hypothetical protein